MLFKAVSFLLIVFMIQSYNSVSADTIYSSPVLTDDRLLGRVEFNNTPLSAGLKELFKRGGLTAITDKSLELDYTSLRFSDVKISDILAVLARNYALRYRHLSQTIVLVEKLDAAERTYSKLPFLERIGTIPSPYEIPAFPSIKMWEYAVVGVEERFDEDIDERSAIGKIDEKTSKRYFFSLNDIQIKILNKWGGLKYPEDAAPAVVSFDVDDMGEISNPKVTTSSGDSAIDQKALNSVITAAPFTPFQNGGTAKVGVSYSFGGITEERFARFMIELQDRIKANWIPPTSEKSDRPHSSNRAAVSFTMHHDGRISNLSLIESSGIASMDRAATKAIEHATRNVRSLPPGSPATIPITFTFDYKLFRVPDSDLFRKFSRHL